MPGCRIGPIAAIALVAALALPRALAEESRKLSVGGMERSYVLSRPAQGPRPTVVVLHGGTLNADNARRSTGFEPLVDREGLVAVYPNALSGHWNDGRSAPRLGWNGKAADDVGFIRALVAGLVREGIADPQRLYVTGPSNGGMMTLRLVCEAADLLAGAAPVIASLPADLAPRCKPARPVAVVVINGTSDPLVPYGGGEVRGERGRVLSTDATMAFLRKVNGCGEKAKTERLPDLDTSDGSSVTVLRWTDCASRAPVVLYRIDGGGHRIPRRFEPPRAFVDRLLGRPNRDFEAAEAIWTFFRSGS